MQELIWSIPAIAIAAILGIGLVIAKLYKRSTKEMAFVRTGFGGEKVILNGGAIVLPVFHEITIVNMQTLRLNVTRNNSQALITKDRMRIDVQAEFYVRVKPLNESVAQAAQALGDRTMRPDVLKDLVEGKFVDALRAVAAEMTMTELHEQRAQFVQKVQTSVSEDLLKNGLELETVSLTGLDQTSKEHFNPDNAFDAEGLLKLTQEIEDKRKKRNDIEQDTKIEIERKNLDARRQSLTIEKDEEYAELEQKREIAIRKAELDAETAEKEAEQFKNAENAKIKAHEETNRERITNERQTEEIRIQKEQKLEEARIAKDIAISNKSEEESNAKAKADQARALAVKEEEAVITARQVAIAERDKKIEIVEAEKEAHREAVAITVGAEAEKKAAQDIADSKKIKAQGEADAIKIVAEADAKKYEVEAKGKESINEAENKLSAEQIAYQIKLRLIAELPKIIEQSVKPMEKIDSIKILQADGLFGGTGNISNGGTVSAEVGSLPDQILNNALKYKMQSPLVDNLLSELGITGINGDSIQEMLGFEKNKSEIKSHSSNTQKQNKSKKVSEVIEENIKDKL
ncbi:flotillin family protein [Candidatus Woesearchaeota archaeon]|nr:flotillin family protein [Candidatus Woesearchaeota archaeon]